MIYAVKGIMQVRSGKSMWLIPPQFALWIPAHTLHRITMTGAVSMRTLYVRCGLMQRMRESCTVLYVSPLLRELVLEAVRVGQLRTSNRVERALRDLLISQLAQARSVPMFITLPREPRALTVAEIVLSQPAANRTLADMCASAGVSPRTLQRVFPVEVGADFESWRRQARLTTAVQLLIGGRSVKESAFAVGYRQCSAFVEAFRKTFGLTPKAWTTAIVKHDLPN